MQEKHTEVVIGGTLQQKLSSCFNALDKFLRQSEPVVSSMIVAEKRDNMGSGSSMIECIANILGETTRVYKIRTQSYLQERKMLIVW